MRSPSNRIPFAARSDSVRRPIGFRPPSDQIPSAARSDSVRRPIRFRSPSDQIAYGDGGISHPLRIKRLRRNNNGLSGCLQGGALVSSAPTKQAVHQTNNNGFLLLGRFNSGLNGLNGFLLLGRFNNGLSGLNVFGGCLQGGALVSSAPTKQSMHQPNNNGLSGLSTWEI